MFDLSSRAQGWRRVVYIGLAILSVVELARLGGQLQKRIAFPWDLLTCFESPHLTALAKLRAGEPLYGPPADANSEPYPPLTAVISYVVLRPLGLELDIRGARAVAVGLTLVTALTAAWITRRTLLSEGAAFATANRVTPLVAATAFLMLHQCVTSDQPHPDNLHILHAVVLLHLCLQATTKHRTSDWLAAATWSSLGILAKQTAAAAPAVVIVLLFFDRKLAPRRRWTLIGLVAAAGIMVACGLLLDPYRDFHLRKALASHAIEWSRLSQLATDFIPLRFFPRVLLWAIGAWSFIIMLREPASRNFLRAWGAVGLFEVLPAVAGFLKHGGYYNNLGVVDFWLFMLIAPVLILHTIRGTTTAAFGATIVCCWFVAALWPMKLVPNQHCHRLGNEMARRVSADIAAGRRVWLTMGVATKFHAGDTTVPRDLGIHLWTLDASVAAGESTAARLPIEEGIRHRLEAGDYDRVYDTFPWDLSAREALAAHYVQAEPIRGAGYSMHESYRGIQPTVNKCKIYELKPR